MVGFIFNERTYDELCFCAKRRIDKERRSKNLKRAERNMEERFYFDTPDQNQ